ncbi:MAG: class I SAM-dependent RNA methyltransferase [Clostridiales bacterium]|nr:class I SAM-dependent RNA methyltransferase [Clostridiales bacterium]
MKITVSAPSGLEGVVKKELYNLTGQDSQALNGRLTIDGDIKTVANLNLNMRTASRVYILLGNFKATNFDELFEGISNIDLENYFDKVSKITVLSNIFESKLNSVQAVKSVAKKAMCKRLEGFYGCNLKEIGANHSVEISIRHDYVSVYLNTSGEPLHKRGYRTSVGDAPIKENVAACMLYLSVWNKSKVLVDPFCGSGTIAIEAGMIAKNIAPGLNRDFDFLHFEKFDTSFYEDMLIKAKNDIVKVDKVSIFGYDIEESQVKLARMHAKKAGVSDAVFFGVKDVCDFTSRESYGVIVTNPPYGERILSRNQVVSLYKTFGRVYSSLDNWSVYAITPVSDFERLIGKKADKKRKIYNGQLECIYYSILGAKPPKKQ